MSAVKITKARRKRKALAATERTPSAIVPKESINAEKVNAARALVVETVGNNDEVKKMTALSAAILLQGLGENDLADTLIDRYSLVDCGINSKKRW